MSRLFAFMLRVNILNVVMLSVVMLNAVMLSVVSQFYLPTKRNKNYFLWQGVLYKMKYDLSQVLAEFSTLSLPVLLHRNITERHMHIDSSRVENSAQVFCLLFQDTQDKLTQHNNK
jgi:hypothetical protein